MNEKQHLLNYQCFFYKHRGEAKLLIKRRKSQYIEEMEEKCFLTCVNLDSVYFKVYLG